MGRIMHVVKRSGAVVDFNPDRITNAIYRAAVAVGGRDRSMAERLSDQVVELLEKTIPDGKTPHIEEIQDLVEKVLIENGHARVAKAYILYRDERARRRQQQVEHSASPSTNIPWAKIWHVLDWSVDHGVNTIAGLNARIARGELDDIIAESEQFYKEDIGNVVEMIARRREGLKIVIITGPSSSGKTTTTIKVGEKLKELGMNLVTLNVDNYFYDLEFHPKDEFGDYDFETPQALDLTLINEHLKRMIAGEEVLIPHYDFKTGLRSDDHTPMKLKPNDVILIDSLHGLYSDMTKDIPAGQKFKLYLEPLLQMKDDDGNYVRWTDIRLIRRMLRDASHRAYDPRRTLEHWHYVRTSEMRNIIPYVNTTDYIVNSSMSYEPCIYRARMLESFARWEQDYKDQPLREDAYIRAQRVHQMLRQFTPMNDETRVPGDSVLREFIGGSTYSY